MTTNSNNRAPTSNNADEYAQANTCEVCAHDQTSHDATATRFCQTTLARALDRNCICRIPELSKSDKRPGLPMYGQDRFSGT